MKSATATMISWYVRYPKRNTTSGICGDMRKKLRGAIMLTVVYEVDAPTLPPSVKETIAMDLEKFGGKVRCVSVTQKGAEQMSMDAWKQQHS